MADPKKAEGTASRELVPASMETHPILAEPVVGEYYGRYPSRSALARSYGHLLVRQRWTLIATFLTVMILGLGWILTRPRLYRSVAEMLVSPIERASGNTSNLADSLNQLTRVRSVATEMKMLKSADLLDEAFSTLPQQLRQRGFGTTASKLHSYPVKITNPKDTDIIAVEVLARDPQAAAEFANQVLLSNMLRRQETMRAIAGMATQHVNEQLARVNDELQQKWAQLSQLKKERGVVEINTQAAADAQWLATLESQATAAAIDRERAALTRETLRKELGNTPAVIEVSRTASANPVVQEIDGQIERLQQQRTQLLQEYLPTAQEVRDIDEQIAEAKRRKAEALQTQAETVQVGRNPITDTLTQNYINAVVSEQESQSRLNLTRARAQQVMSRISTLPEAERQIALLNSRISELQTTHAYLTNQKEELDLRTRVGQANVMPITNARPGRAPVSPNVPTSAMLLTILAALLALALAVVRDQLDDRIHTETTLEGLTGRRVLASLPQVSNGFRGLVTGAACPPALLESFRILRANMLLASLDPLPRVIMITSPGAGEGKSTTVANLAATLAISGKRVLVVDCDLRHPSVHQVYGISNERGLSSLLEQEATLEECIAPTMLDRLQVLPAGPTPAFPPELLTSPAMSLLLGELRDRYDAVLIDSTPIVNLSDAALLAPLADGILVVVASAHTRYPDLNSALHTLEQVGTPILGLVYNRSEEAPSVRWSD